MSNGSGGGDPGPLIRPYALTGGRTESRLPDLAMEDLISATQAGMWELHTLDHQHRSIVEGCQRPLSVAEISAHHGIPLGVARILISDLVGSGLVQVHRSAAADNGRPSLELLGRVLERLQAL